MIYITKTIKLMMLLVSLIMANSSLAKMKTALLALIINGGKFNSSQENKPADRTPQARPAVAAPAARLNITEVHRTIIAKLTHYAHQSHQNIQAFFNPSDTRKLASFAAEMQTALNFINNEVISTIPHGHQDALMNAFSQLAHDLKTVQQAFYSTVSQSYRSSLTLIPALMSMKNNAQLRDALNKIKTSHLTTIKRLCPDASSMCTAIHNLVSFEPNTATATMAISKRV